MYYYIYNFLDMQTEFKPTIEQETAISKSLEHIVSGDISAIVGSAGTGKSKSASIVLEMLPNQHEWTVTFLAYTNKATSNIEKMIWDANLSHLCEVSTIHSFLKINKEHIDHRTGKRTFKQNKQFIHHEEDYNPAKHLLVVDEMGIVPNNVESPLATLLLELPNPILALGDDCQCPPPQEELGQMFALFEENTYRLTQTHRFGGALLEVATYIRDRIKERTALDILHESDNDGSTGIFKLSSTHFSRTIDKIIKEDEFISNPLFFRVITWRKATMDYWNQYIRSKLYGSAIDTQLFLPGERIIAMEACNKKTSVRTADRTFRKTDKLLSASEEATVFSVEESWCDLDVLKTDLKTYYVDVLTDRGISATLHVIHPDYAGKLDAMLKGISSEAKKYASQGYKREAKAEWIKYWELKEYFHNIKPAFSLNIDRIQGMTIENIAVDLSDAYSCRDIWKRNRIAYTMVTRAKKKVYIN